MNACESERADHAAGTLPEACTHERMHIMHMHMYNCNMLEFGNMYDMNDA